MLSCADQLSISRYKGGVDWVWQKGVFVYFPSSITYYTLITITLTQIIPFYVF